MVVGGCPEVLISDPACEGSPGHCKTHHLGAAVERCLAWAFSRLGYVVARHPILTLVLTAAVVGALCGGLTMFTVTTNPVELWSDPKSRARQEKDYFEKHFG